MSRLNSVILWVGVLLFLVAPIVAEPVHLVLHPTANQTNHQESSNCSICHFITGANSEPPVTVVTTVPTRSSFILIPAKVGSPLLTFFFSQAQPRSPPTFA